LESGSAFGSYIVHAVVSGLTALQITTALITLLSLAAFIEYIRLILDSSMQFANNLSRINIGNARLQGLEKDLHMDREGPKFNIALFMFFIPYILLEVPSNLVLKRMRPSIWLSSIMLGWGG
jgi:hypothetical protein